MKKISFISCGAALLFLVVTVLAADNKQTAPTDAQAKVAELAKQVDALQSKIKGLEQRLAKLEKEKPIFTGAPISGGSVITVPPAVPNREFIQEGFADPNNPPKIWGEGECNGWKYYTIPLSATGRGAAIQIPLAVDPLAAR